MKTREEMIYDFMLALCANPEMTPNALQPHVIADCIFEQASSLVTKVLETS